MVRSIKVLFCVLTLFGAAVFAGCGEKDKAPADAGSGDAAASTPAEEGSESK